MREPGYTNRGHVTTIQDVAALAKVSPTTVSHMLSGRRPVSVATRARIQEAIELLQFRPNEMARALRAQRSKTVALLVRDIAEESNPLAAKGAHSVLHDRGFNLVIYESNGDPDTLFNSLKSITDRRTDGVITTIPGITDVDMRYLRDNDVPYVYAGSPTEIGGPTFGAYMDATEGIALAARHVLAITTGKIGYVGGPEDDPISQPRHTGFTQVMASTGRFSPSLSTTSPWSYAGGRAAMARILESGEPMSGVVCANDLLAIGAAHEAIAHGLSIPGDLVITGYDNIEASAMVSPSLTTIDAFPAAVAAAATNLLLAVIDGSTESNTGISIAANLVIRESAPAFRRN